MTKRYWSQRKGITAKFDLTMLKKSWLSIFNYFTSLGYYQEYYGYLCVDAGSVDGKAGNDISEFIFRKTRRIITYPFSDLMNNLDEDTFFDLIELFHDTISFPVEGFYHSYSGCGYHYNKFDAEKGQEEYRKNINEILLDYGDGYEINKNGEIQILLTPGLKELTDASVPVKQDENIRITYKLNRAINKYRDRHSDFGDRKEAVRELADILEYLRPTIKIEMLSKDENELFNIANNFAIRHNRDNQKEDYNLVWLSWIFYLFLSTIHLCIRLRKE